MYIIVGNIFEVELKNMSLFLPNQPDEKTWPQMCYDASYSCCSHHHPSQQGNPAPLAAESRCSSCRRILQGVAFIGLFTSRWKSPEGVGRVQVTCLRGRGTGIIHFWTLPLGGGSPKSGKFPETA